MYEDRTIEERYLYNFSPAEKAAFIRHETRQHELLAEYQLKLDTLMAEGSTAIFRNNDPSIPTDPLEIKYILNRIAANDPRDTSFELGAIDDISNGDQYAIQIARSFQTNTACKIVILGHMNLTDKGLLPILSVLRKKELLTLDISGNPLTDKSFARIDRISREPNNLWHHVKLGTVELSPERALAFKKNPYISFSYRKENGALGLFTAQPFLGRR